ncbi:serine hydrolase domain-containing protein [Sphingosinicella rhizophila]|uniref:serine hydrolase domain-containing protein n=1 Tax=Sphingosinicella rhizophila TaxID=3050082 RepID=UPI0028EC945B|nr:serine hydrolase domain-containing protein [Sphingosinicella sp. GR2756]
MSAHAGPLSPAAIAAIDRIVDQLIEGGATPGMVVGISVNGAPAFVRGYGSADLEDNIPVTDRTVFRIGSLTKQFTAAALLLLVEDGKVSVDDPLARYFPDFPRGDEVTLRQLLTHTSGIHNYTAVKEYFPTLGRQDLTTEEMVDYITKLDTLYDFDPGTGYNYSNSGYYLLGAIIEKVSGQPFAAFLKARLLVPLGLHDTAVDDTSEIVPNRANGYSAVAGAPGKFTNATYIAMSAAGAAGAMRSTAHDLLAWEKALLGGKVLKPASLAMMLAPGKLSNGQSSSTAMKSSDGRAPFEYGFGILTDQDAAGRRMIGHGGAIQGFNAYIRTLPEENVAIAVLANGSGGAALSNGPKLIEALFDAGRN